MAHQIGRRLNDKAPQRMKSMSAEPKRARDHDAEPIPGSRKVSCDEKFDYLVTLRQLRDDSNVDRGRRQVYQSGVAQTAEFLGQLHHWLKENDLCGEVSALGEPLGFPMVAITCTPRVAKLIESMPEVQSVFRDSRDFQFVR